MNLDKNGEINSTEGHGYTYVVDTCILIDCPKFFFKVGDGRIIVPTTVIEELQRLAKRKNIELAETAQKVLGTLEELGCTGDTSFTGSTETGASVTVYNRYLSIDGLEDTNDNRIIGAAMSYRLENEDDENVILITNDWMMIRTSRAYGVRAELRPPSWNIPVNPKADAAGSHGVATAR